MLMLNKPLRRKERLADTRSADQFYCDAVVKRADPTGTFRLRRSAVAQSWMRFKAVRTILKKAIVEQDMLGLKPGSMSPIAVALAPGNRQIAFQTWIDDVMRRVIIEEGKWMQPIVAQAYTKAVARGMRLTQSAIAPDVAANAVANMWTLAVTELQGIVEAVSQRIMREATLAMVHRGTPRETFKSMEVAFDKVGLRRVKALLDMIVVKSFTAGTLDQFEAAGIRIVGLVSELKPMFRDAKRKRKGPGSRIGREEAPSRRTVGRIRAVQRELEGLQQVEVMTAGDNRVCEECEAIEENNPYTLNEARSLIPAHIECRCAFVPVE